MRIGLFGYLVVLLAGTSLPATDAVGDKAINFFEVYELIKEQVRDADPVVLNRAAVTGLLGALDGRVLLVNDPAKISEQAALAKLATFDESVIYLRPQRIGGDLATKVADTMRACSATNELKGVILDLRFVTGEDYAAAVAVADLFVVDERPLLDWGQGMVKSKSRSPGPRMPVAVLVNQETRGAAEALAGMLREAGAALILGNATAGNAFIFQEFPLQTGQKLLIAAGNVKLGDGSELPLTGLWPDILVNVQPEAERFWQADPYASRTPREAVAAVGTSAARAARLSRISEADLVRERRDGTNFLDTPTARERVPEKPQLQDPVLARAVDLVKGLAVVRAGRL